MNTEQIIKDMEKNLSMISVSKEQLLTMNEAKNMYPEKITILRPYGCFSSGLEADMQRYSQADFDALYPQQEQA